jgi:hypothetical protein
MHLIQKYLFTGNILEGSIFFRQYFDLQILWDLEQGIDNFLIPGQVSLHYPTVS